MPKTVIVGPPSLLARCAPASAAGLATIAIDGPLTADAIAATGADAVVAFEPSTEQRGAVEAAGLPALLWWSDEPPAADAARWTADGRCRTICGASPAPPGTWRSVAIPVADALYDDLDAAAAPVAIGFGDADDGRAAAEHRARVALARGQLLIGEPLAPARGLEPGTDYLEARAPEDAEMLAANAARSPVAFERIRLRGRLKAELFRASAVVERLVGDLLLELGLEPGARAQVGRP